MEDLNKEETIHKMIARLKYARRINSIFSAVLLAVSIGLFVLAYDKPVSIWIFTSSYGMVRAAVMEERANALSKEIQLLENTLKE